MPSSQKMTSKACAGSIHTCKDLSKIAGVREHSKTVRIPCVLFCFQQKQLILIFINHAQSTLTLLVSVEVYRYTVNSMSSQVLLWLRTGDGFHNKKAENYDSYSADCPKHWNDMKLVVKFISICFALYVHICICTLYLTIYLSIYLHITHNLHWVKIILL